MSLSQTIIKFETNYITLISTTVTHGHDSTHIRPNKIWPN
jgi:hypothetical protein